MDEEIRQVSQQQYAIDSNNTEADGILRGAIRAEDPMAQFVEKKQSTGTEAEKSIFLCPNRFNIVPGRRWDGVDRSNGFERRFLQKQNEKQAREENSYRMSFDM